MTTSSEPIATSESTATRAELQAASVNELAIVIMAALAGILAPLNSTMIVVALPHIVRDLRTSLAAADWLVTLYLITMATCQPVAGKLGDRFGRRPLIIGALLYFFVASLGATLAPNLLVLIFFRVQQGIAAGTALPNAMALVREVVPESRRGSRFGLIGSITSVAAAVGPPLGGILTGLITWRAVFAVNLILVAPALIVGWWAMPRFRIRAARPAFDVLGSILMGAVLIACATLLIRAAHQSAPVDLALAVAIVVLGIAFIRHELGNADPVLQLRLFRRRTFAAGNAAIALSNLAMYTVLLAIPLLAARSHHISAVQTGLILAALSAANVIASPIGGRLADRYGRRKPAAAGLTLFTAALLPLPLTSVAAHPLPLAVTLAVAGVGLGLAWSGLFTAVVESVEPSEAGMASGLSSTARYYGSIVGTSLLASLVVGSSGVAGFLPVFILVAVAAAISALAAVFVADRPRPATS